MKTKQELFDTMVRGFRDQDWKASFDEKREICLYRGPNGTQCAGGHLLTDEQAMLYNASTWDELPVAITGLIGHKAFVHEAQRTHDNFAYGRLEFSSLRDAFKHLGKCCGLAWPDDC